MTRADDIKESIAQTTANLTDIRPRGADRPTERKTELDSNVFDEAACRIMTRANNRTQGIAPGRINGADTNTNDRQTEQDAAGIDSSIRLQPELDATSATDDTLPAARRRKRKRMNLLQLAAPTAYKDIIKNKWSIDYIVNEQRSDPTLTVVRTWLENVARQTEMPTDPELRDYWLQFDILILNNNVLYRQYFDTVGNVTDLQILIPPTFHNENNHTGNNAYCSWTRSDVSEK